LHFGAVAWQAPVMVTGKELASIAAVIIV